MTTPPFTIDLDTGQPIGQQVTPPQFNPNRALLTFSALLFVLAGIIDLLPA